MPVRSLLLLVSSLLLHSACVADEDAGQALFTLSSDDAIVVADQGTRSEILGCSGTCVTRESFWVDLSVRNDAYGKDVAIVWSADGWATQHVAPASFERSLVGGREQWGVDVTLGQFWAYNPRPAEVAYAAYVRMAGQTHWDRYNDHYVYQPVDAAHPVRLLGSQVRFEAGTGAILSGTVRVYDLAYPKQVGIRYTTDGWHSYQDLDATWLRDDDWSFRTASLGLASLPERVEFVVRYRVAGQELWDSAGGANFVHRLRPDFQFVRPEGVQGRPASGVVHTSVTAVTDLPVARVQLRLDGGAWLGEPPDARYPSPSQAYSFSTAGLADGTHTLGARVELAGGFVAEADTDFAVANRLRPLGTWRPTLAASDDGRRGETWGLATGGDGRVHLEWDAPTRGDAPVFHGIVRYDGYGDAEAPLVYDPLPGGPSGWPPSVWDISVDAGGRVWGMENQYPGVALWRWAADGRLDAGFGAGGRLDLPVAMVGFDVGRAIAAGDGALWIVRTCPGYQAACNPGVSRVSADGAVIDHIDLPPEVTTPARPYPIDPGAATYADGALWVLRGRTITRVAQDANGQLSIAGTVTFADRIDVFPDAIARAADGRFFVLSSYTLLAFTADGAFEGAWTLGGTDAFEGGAQLPRALAALPDGTVAVLDVSGASLLRFAGPR